MDQDTKFRLELEAFASEVRDAQSEEDLVWLADLAVKLADLIQGV